MQIGLSIEPCGKIVLGHSMLEENKFFAVFV